MEIKGYDFLLHHQSGKGDDDINHKENKEDMQKD